MVRSLRPRGRKPPLARRSTADERAANPLRPRPEHGRGRTGPLRLSAHHGTPAEAPLRSSQLRAVALADQGGHLTSLPLKPGPVFLALLGLAAGPALLARPVVAGGDALQVRLPRRLAAISDRLFLAEVEGGQVRFTVGEQARPRRGGGARAPPERATRRRARGGVPPCRGRAGGSASARPTSTRASPGRTRSGGEAQARARRTGRLTRAPSRRSHAPAEPGPDPLPRSRFHGQATLWVGRAVGSGLSAGARHD